MNLLTLCPLYATENYEIWTTAKVNVWLVLFVVCKVRDKAILILYAKVYPLFIVVPFLVLP